MADATLPNNRRELPTAELPRASRPAIAGLRSQLKRQIRSYVLFVWTALVVVVFPSAFCLSLGLDWIYFGLTGLELPVWFRGTVAIGTIVLAAAGALFWIVLRLFRRVRARSLALVLGGLF